VSSDNGREVNFLVKKLSVRRQIGAVDRLRSFLDHSGVERTDNCGEVHCFTLSKNKTFLYMRGHRPYDVSKMREVVARGNIGDQACK
jgi:hypothetical protein